MIFVGLMVLFSTLGASGDYHTAAERQSVQIQQTGRDFVSSVRRQLSKPWDGHFAAQNFKSAADKSALATIKKNLQTVVIALPKTHTEALKSLEVRNTEHVSRGLANSKKIILNTGKIDDEAELQAVFIHELGHVIDLGKMQGQNGRLSAFKDGKRKIYTDDPSLAFYRLSWTNEKKRLTTSSNYDFVSGYAMSDAFEDFAETYLFYRLHGAKFRAATTKSDVLGAKYAFMRDQVFAGQEFQTDEYVENYVPGLIWDATLLPYEGL